MTLPYIAASSYLNAAPLCYSFMHGSQQDRCRFLSDAAPSRCADLLREGQADAALIPVIEYQRIKGLRIVPGACVSSRKSVRSVLLASKVPIDRVRRVALDISSRTSAALIQIILGRFHGLSPVYQTFSPRIQDMLETNDAALLIGDPAMLIDRSGLHVYDLAEEWIKHTDLPFVFAFWAFRPDKEGVLNIGRIAEAYSTNLGLPQEDLVRYLTENINFDLDERSLQGLRLYYQLALECGLIDNLTEPVFSFPNEEARL
jgi:chorismate dehydratase